MQYVTVKLKLVDRTLKLELHASIFFYKVEENFKGTIHPSKIEAHDVKNVSYVNHVNTQLNN